MPTEGPEVARKGHVSRPLQGLVTRPRQTLYQPRKHTTWRKKTNNNKKNSVPRTRTEHGPWERRVGPWKTSEFAPLRASVQGRRARVLPISLLDCSPIAGSRVSRERSHSTVTNDATLNCLWPDYDLGHYSGFPSGAVRETCELHPETLEEAGSTNN